MATPGCIRDDTCSSRGRVNITGTLSSGSNVESFALEIFQTNNFDKVDQIYFGNVNASSFPKVMMSPMAGQTLDTITIVAQSIDFILLNATSSSEPTGTGTPASSASTSSRSSLSTGAKIGIGAAVPVAVIVIAAILGAYLVQKKRRERKLVEGLHDKPQLDATEVPRQELETKANIRELDVHETPGELVSLAEPAELAGG
ncbi:hypothetical protein N431DRAFT_428760 [Stipitochalara longipes BDJ]|nr:hypothetical protein N431DRAFT_428760 [Stipitochalara longipes BDJ]